MIKQHRLLLTGFQSNVDQYLKESDYMLMPSKKEGLGMAAIEAQVSGVYVFASDRLPLDTDLGLISYLPYEMSASQWADEIHNFVMNEMKYSRSLNRKRLQKFDITRIAEQIALFYES
ncbi:glycosyltransferase [Phocaeicola massiliensis]|uniref:glycosyltransferase n=1 Tax=Phocaeicola massiliensis TaxID=204516 RepID=UPI0025482769|nr:glycosyltransferase [Phocaeicola massiliensis]